MKKETKISSKESMRLTKVVDVEIIPDLGFMNPKRMLKDHNLDDKKQTTIMLQTQTGLDEVNTLTVKVENEAVENFLKTHSIGTILEDQPSFYLDFMEHQKTGNNLETLFSVNIDGFFPTCYEVLKDADVIDETYNFKKEHLDTFPESKKNWARALYHDNWELVLETEYVYNKYPRSSLASYAVKIFFNYFIACDDEATAYLWREMQMIQNQEQTALKYIKLKESAGDGGGRVSSNKKSNRLDSLISHMEAIISDNKILSEMKPLHVAELALKRAIQDDVGLWKQGKGQLENYLTILCSDKKYKDRFDAMFSKPLKQF